MISFKEEIEGIYTHANTEFRQMVYDENFASRVKQLMETKTEFDEKKMFGGLTFMVNGHMAVGVLKNDFVVRIGPDQYGDALQMPNTRKMDFTGRSIKGMVYVNLKTLDDENLNTWIDKSLNFVNSLEPK